MDALTEHLSSYVAGLAYSDIPARAAHGMKVRLIDTIGCAIGGRDGEPVALARALAREASATAPARVWFTGERTTPELAVFANELMVRYLDFNDTYFAMEGGHPSDTIAATLTLSEALGLSGQDALVAMVAAYEVFCGLGEVQKPSAKFIDHSLHVAIGSAAGASKALGLNAERTAHAISIALTANPGLRIARDGHLSMWKAGSAGNAAQAGVFAARLAEKGMTGPSEAFYADSGLAGILGGRTPLPSLGGPSHPFHTDMSSIKAFPAQFNAQAAVWAALGLRERLGGALPDTIAVRSYRQAITSSADPEKWHVHDRETADHSIPYLVAVALLDGEVTTRQFTDERIADPLAQELIARTEGDRGPGDEQPLPRSAGGAHRGYRRRRDVRRRDRELERERREPALGRGGRGEVPVARSRRDDGGADRNAAVAVVGIRRGAPRVGSHRGDGHVAPSPRRCFLSAVAHFRCYPPLARAVSQE